MRPLRRVDVTFVLLPVETETASRDCTGFTVTMATTQEVHTSHTKKKLLVVNLGKLSFPFVSNKGSQFWTLKCTIVFILHSLLAVTSHVKEKISFACFGMLSYCIEHTKWRDVSALHAHLSRGCVSIRKFVTETHGKKTMNTGISFVIGLVVVSALTSEYPFLYECKNRNSLYRSSVLIRNRSFLYNPIFK